METIKQVLMRRDRMTDSEAESVITEAKDAITDYLGALDFDSAGYVCEEYFGLEADYIFELLT